MVFVDKIERNYNTKSVRSEKTEQVTPPEKEVVKEVKERSTKAKNKAE